MGVTMQKALAHFVTDCAQVTAYVDHVKVCPALGRGQFVLYGQIARNLFGNQEYLLPLVTINEVTGIVGSTASDEVEGIEGKTYQDLVIEKVDDGIYRIGYSGDLDLSIGVMVDETALNAIVKACRVFLLSGEIQDIGYDEDFWVVHAKIDGDLVSISPQIFEIVAENGFKITIGRDNVGDWLQIFSTAAELEVFEPRSMIRINDTISIYKSGEDSLHLKMVIGERQIGITAKSKFFEVCHRLMGMVWLGEDIYDEGFALIFDDEEDYEDDEDEAGSPS
jgi:hypothetical protein